jgi:hypothetical protein
MTFSQRSDVKKHLAHPLKKTHYLTPENQNSPAEKVDQELAADTSSTATLPDDRKPFLVANVK